MNVCSYHLQEAGATPEQELAFALATACAVLDEVRPKVPAEDFPQVVGRISFFVNAGIRFVTEMCKMRAFVDLWDEICASRYGVEDAKLRRFRYGVQVNSLGLTEQQPENNVYRILLETLAVTLSKNARARAVQLPAWNEALGLPRPWDQQWSLRLQQVLAYETDLLEYGDLFDGSPVVERQGRGAEGRRPRRAGPDRRDGRRGRRHRLHEGGAGGLEHRAPRPHRVRRDRGRRRQPIHRDRALAPLDRRGQRADGRPRRRGRPDRRASPPGARRATRRRSKRRWPS